MVELAAGLTRSKMAPMSDIQRRRESNEIIVVAPVQSAAHALRHAQLG
jgi:hypothetical protein